MAFVSGFLSGCNPKSFRSSAVGALVVGGQSVSLWRRRVVVSATLTYYRGFTNRTRSAQVDWYIAELKKENEIEKVRLDIQSEVHKNPEVNAHPFLKVPSIVAEDGTVIFESAVLLSYLARRFDGLDLTEEQRAEMESWIVWVNASFGPAIFNEESRPAGLSSLAVLEETLSKRDYICSFNQFSAADVALTYLITTISRIIPFPEDFDSKHPALTSYFQRNCAREAYLLTIASQA